MNKCWPSSLSLRFVESLHFLSVLLRAFVLFSFAVCCHSMNSLIENLSLSHEEEDELILDPDSLSNRAETFNLYLTSRFLTDQQINFNLMRNRLAGIWRPKQGVEIRDLGSHRFLFQFFYPIDLQRVIDSGPWSFNNFLLIFHQLKEGEHPLRVPLESISFWIQVHDFPVGYLSESIGRQLGNFIGRFIDYDEMNSSVIWRAYMRIRVAIDVSNPLKRCKKIRKAYGSSFLANFKYEKLGFFCFICGRLGHTKSFCDVLFTSSDQNIKRE